MVHFRNNSTDEKDENSTFNFAVSVLEAKYIPGSEELNVMVTLQMNHKRKKTKAVKKAINPIWNQVFPFSVPKGDNQLILLVQDDHHIRKDCVGYLVFKMKEVKELCGKSERWHFLQQAGEFNDKREHHSHHKEKASNQTSIQMYPQILLKFSQLGSLEHEELKAIRKALPSTADDEDKLGIVRLIPRLMASIFGIIYCLEPVLALRKNMTQLVMWKDRGASIIFLLMFLWVSYNEYYVSAFAFLFSMYWSISHFKQNFGATPQIFIRSDQYSNSELKLLVRDIKDRNRVGRKTSVQEDVRKADQILNKILSKFGDIREVENYKENSGKFIMKWIIVGIIGTFFPVFRIFLFLLKWGIMIGVTIAFTVVPLFAYYPQLKKSLRSEAGDWIRESWIYRTIVFFRNDDPSLETATEASSIDSPAFSLSEDEDEEEIPLIEAQS
eukprot:TRINITY_DN3689_c0_g1_i1.p1 TRINITY_DN3689_c0_g1~~TRINITY_DN3689_c0_g1_i1.p1  ORF type:complete len:441 (-),score=128.77 TRINITY_DN3689_c0_g1_i1:332-1654(-)